jgi:xylulokinase
VEVLPTWPITKILWLRTHEPEVFQKAAKYILVEDYILYRLTNQFVGDFSLYSSSYMIDIHRKCWWQEILDLVDISPQQLVELHESGVIIGSVGPDICAELGLDRDVDVVTGCMDQTAAMVGAGNIQDGVVTATIGAALVLCETVESFPEHKSDLMAVQCHAIPDRYFLLGWCACGGMSLKWLRDTFFSVERDQALRQKNEPYDALTEMAKEVPIGSQGLLFFPFMSGPGTLAVDPNLRGIFYGLELHHQRSHFVRAVMESLAFVLRENLEEISRLGTTYTEIRTLGGGARSDLWNQIIADVTGTKVATMICQEAASLGMAVLQAVATGLYEDLDSAVGAMVRTDRIYTPDIDSQRIYDKAYQRYLEVERGRFSKKQ